MRFFAVDSEHHKPGRLRFETDIFNLSPHEHERIEMNNSLHTYLCYAKGTNVGYVRPSCMPKHKEGRVQHD